MIYKFSKNDLESSIGRELAGIAATAKLAIDVAEHENIFRDDSGKINGLESFIKLRSYLRLVKKENRLKKPIYTLRKAPDFEKSRELEFVVMTNLEKGMPYTGNRIKASEYALQAFEMKKPVSTPLYEDSEGVWISGIAPLIDETGYPYALLYIDKDVNFFMAKLSVVKTEILLITLLGLAVGGVAFFFTARHLVQRIQQLIEGTKKVASGNLDFEIIVSGHDEVKQLAESFNVMTKDLAQHEANLARLNEDLKKTNAAYRRFVPQEFLSFLDKKSIIDIRLGDQTQKEMTVLFSDIRSFTSMSEQMSPQENFNYLNSYLTRIQPIISNRNGFIDKYIGDAIMALFAHSVDDAVMAAIEMQKEIARYNEHRKEQGYMPITVGMGIHTGALMLGTIGSEERMEGTVISDAVNLSSRLQDLTKNFVSQVIISEDALEKLSSREKIDYRLLGKARVKGKVELITIYEIFTGNDESTRKLKTETRGLFEAAIKDLLENRYEDAKKKFHEVLLVHPGDPIALKLSKRIEGSHE